MTYSVIISRRVRADLRSIAAWVTREAGREVATAYVRRIDAACQRLADFPFRGAARDDLVPGLRTLAFERRATIAYRVEGDQVTIVSVLHRGRDVTGALG